MTSSRTSFSRRLIVWVATAPRCATNLSLRTLVCVQLPAGAHVELDEPTLRVEGTVHGVTLDLDQIEALGRFSRCCRCKMAIIRRCRYVTRARCGSLRFDYEANLAITFQPADVLAFEANALCVSGQPGLQIASVVGPQMDA